MKVGDIMECALLTNGKRTGAFVRVEIRQISRHWKTGEPTSVRVRAQEGVNERFVWVQPQMLRAIKQKEGQL